MAPVYNLTVEGAHCYYANGVLVHNCDTVTMALSYFRNKFIFQTADDELDKGELDEAMIRHTEQRRQKRTLYSGVPTRGTIGSDDDEPSATRNLTDAARRRLYG